VLRQGRENRELKTKEKSMNPYTTCKIGDIVIHNPSERKAEVIGIYEDLIWLKFRNGSKGKDYDVVIAPTISPWLKYKKYDLVLMGSSVFEIINVVETGYHLRNISEGHCCCATYDDKDIIRKVGVAT
jgi:hypothetical protein